MARSLADVKREIEKDVAKEKAGKVYTLQGCVDNVEDAWEVIKLITSHDLVEDEVVERIKEGRKKAARTNVKTMKDMASLHFKFSNINGSDVKDVYNEYFAAIDDAVNAYALQVVYDISKDYPTVFEDTTTLAALLKEAQSERLAKARAAKKQKASK